MKYRIVLTIFEDGRNTYTPMKKYKYWPFWLHFTFTKLNGSPARIVKKSFEGADEVIKDEIKEKRKRVKKKSIVIRENEEQHYL